ncbi:glycosyltransferase family 2 protein, partial [Candidatus Woesearchaeota archaeon]|nr:glycosyltransferase family 2 protein [Candidatus Woesearchaeota archaeon]
MKKLSVIIPCYNEQDNIKIFPKELIGELDKLRVSYEVIAVDDGSKDSTYSELKKLKKKYPQIKIVRHEQNIGLASAIKSGIDHATGELAVTLDADLTFHPRQIKSLLERFNKGDVDVVIGSPSLKGYSKDVPKYRILISKCGEMLYNFALGKRITAVTPIFRLYKTEQLKEIKLSPKKMPKGGFGINAEILAKLLIKKRRVVEIPATLTVRV